MIDKNNDVKLTQYSRGAGCGCKIAPHVLQEIIGSSAIDFVDKKILVGNSANDDAAVYDLGNGTALISTTDFFMPIVDDAQTFGRIAACNALSDVYAMGGKPIMAIAILGWPIDKLSTALAKEVIEGARSACSNAQIMLAGGHSIDSAEPFFGLAVNGLVNIQNLKRNNTAQDGDLLFLTKRIGTGIYSTAQKRGILQNEDEQELIAQLSSLNSIGEVVAKFDGVSAMTDVTGFGLLGHLVEMCGEGLSAELYYGSIPLMKSLPHYLQLKTIPDATFRNWNAYGKHTGFDKGINVMEAFNVLPDPQTNGGLLIAVRPSSMDELQAIFNNNGLSEFSQPIGKFVRKNEKTILVKNGLFEHQMNIIS